MNIINFYKFTSLLGDILIFLVILSVFFQIFELKKIRNKLWIYGFSFVLLTICFALNNYLNYFLLQIDTYDYIGLWPISITYVFCILFLVFILI